MFYIITGLITLSVWIALLFGRIYAEDEFDSEIVFFLGMVSIIPVINLVLLIVTITVTYSHANEENDEIEKKINTFYRCDYCDDLPYRFGHIHEHSLALMRSKPICPGCEHDMTMGPSRKSQLDINTDVTYSPYIKRRDAVKLDKILASNKHRYKKNELDSRYQKVQDRIRPERLARMEAELEELKQIHFNSINQSTDSK